MKSILQGRSLLVRGGAAKATPYTPPHTTPPMINLFLYDSLTHWLGHYKLIFSFWSDLPFPQDAGGRMIRTTRFYDTMHTPCIELSSWDNSLAFFAHWKQSAKLLTTSTVKNQRSRHMRSFSNCYPQKSCFAWSANISCYTVPNNRHKLDCEKLTRAVDQKLKINLYWP